MSIIFGIRRPYGDEVTKQEMLHLASATGRYAPDGAAVMTNNNIGMGYQPYHTHKRSYLDKQPVADSSNNIIAFDGRLDNHAELCQVMRIEDPTTSDSAIALKAFHHWGEECFSHFVGDWALALWSSHDRATFLARDHAGTRSLYFRHVEGVLQWSTFLETFFIARERNEINVEYAALYLSLQPTKHLTPYANIQSVPPAHYIIERNDQISVRSHWTAIKPSKIQYRSPAEYDEHFLSLFQQSVGRRDDPSVPPLAQLSGGMDSTAIVNMSDRYRKSRNDSSDLIDTVSFYDDTEANWDERPFFTLVEAARAKSGIHIRTSYADRTFEPLDPQNGPQLLPGYDSSSLMREITFERHLDGREFRSLLSGTGGDEVLGGLPTPLPELADYLASGKTRQLFQKSVTWCLVDRTPLIAMLFQVVKFTAGLYFPIEFAPIERSPWLSPYLRNLCTRSHWSQGLWSDRFRYLPSAINNSQAWSSIIETLPHLYPAILTRREYRYPYLDRDLVDFLFAVPREQLVSPGRRRLLMRRALRNIVPNEILERRRKAFIVRGPLTLLHNSQSIIESLFKDSLTAAWGFIDPTKLRAVLQRTIKCQEPIWLIALMRTIGFELWLRSNSGSITHTLLNPHQRKIMLRNSAADKIRVGQSAG